MKKGLMLIGMSLLYLTSCKNNNSNEGIVAMNAAKLSKASKIFMKNNAPEVYQGNPFKHSEAYINYEFELGDYNGDGEVDLFAIKKQNTDTNYTEIHVLSGANEYKSSLLKTRTILKGDYANCKFELGDYNNDGKIDLYAIKKQNIDSNFIEIHILSGASNYRSSLLKTETILDEAYSNYEFQLGDYNNDGKVDLYALKTDNIHDELTQVHILNGASNYTSFLDKSDADLNQRSIAYDFNSIENMRKRRNLYKLKKQSRMAGMSDI